MKALKDLHDELVAIYGYQVEVCAALHQWHEYLSGRRRKIPATQMYFGRDIPTRQDSKYQYAPTVAYLINASKKNGINARIHRRGVVALTYAIWEDQYRSKIACECGLANKNEVKSDIFYDLNRYRQAILHAGGVLVGKPKVIHLFKPGDEVLLTDDHMYQIFSHLIDELNRIGKTYYGQDPQLSLDKSLNTSC